mgnify:CR=1 FL=1
MPEQRLLRAIIVDDEPLAVQRLRILCDGIDGLEVAGTAIDGAGALRLIDEATPDVLLIDIQMPNVDGFAVAHALQERSLRPALIFVTAYDKFAVAAFDVAATDYLLKPVGQERLVRAIGRARAQLDGPPRQASASPWITEFWVPHRGEITRVMASDIDFIEAERDYMRLYVGARSFMLHQTITELERKLDPDVFMRIHRSVIVRKDRVTALKRTEGGALEVHLGDGRQLRVGRTYAGDTRAFIRG